MVAATTTTRILTVLVLLLALYCAIDPFHHSAIYGFPDFVSLKVDLPDWSLMPKERDTQNLLQKSEIMFRNQVQGPESIAFDPQGRGPYTGIADGRVVFWDGEKWITFAFTSSNRNFIQLVFSGDDTGRVLKYDPKTKKATVLVRNLQFPNGLSLSKDGSFFVFCEGSKGRLLRYWLKGEKAGTWDTFAILHGVPDNVRVNKDGEFWVAIHCFRSLYGHVMAKYPKLRNFLLKLPISAKVQYLINLGFRPHAIAVKYSPEGKLLQILEDSQGKVMKVISEVEEKDGKLWIGSVIMPYIGVYKLA
ncbi:hypothetical protein ACFE04_012868 [Oxalis oulophora]